MPSLHCLALEKVIFFAANLQEISVHVSVFSKCHMRDPWFFGDWRWLPEVDLGLVHHLQGTVNVNAPFTSKPLACS
jgi:hypothetical protein